LFALSFIIRKAKFVQPDEFNAILLAAYGLPGTGVFIE
jgi:hypothetical protein